MIRVCARICLKINGFDGQITYKFPNLENDGFISYKFVTNNSVRVHLMLIFFGHEFRERKHFEQKLSIIADERKTSHEDMETHWR